MIPDRRLSDLKFYYSNYKVQHHIIRYLYNRECMAMSPKAVPFNFTMRNLRIHNTQSFQFWMRFMRMFQDRRHTFNFYYSMAQFRYGVPFRDTRQGNLKQDFSGWNERCGKEIDVYDMLIDIDAGSFDEMPDAQESAVMLKRLFDHHHVPHHLRYSGMGFHLVIPYRYLNSRSISDYGHSTNPDEGHNVYQRMRRIAETLHNTVSEMIDTTIYDSRRVAKIPYSVAVYDEGDYICVPVEDIQRFDWRECRMSEKFKKADSFIPDTLHNPDGDISLFERWQDG